MSHIENHVSRRHASPRPSPPSPLTGASPTTSANDNDNDKDASSSDVDDLPYPLPLPRAPFTVPPATFSAPAYLSTLSQRHQTLSDLRADLRARSQLIARELLDLVNADYADFLSLGQALRGGDERVEEVRVGVLGLRSALADVAAAVERRHRDVAALLRRREGAATAARVARALLEVEARLAECEDALGVAQDNMMGGGAWGKKKKRKSNNKIDRGDGGAAAELSDDDSDYDDDDDDDDDSDDADEQQDIPGAVSLARLRRLVRQYLSTRQLAEHIGAEHPFLVAQEPRLIRIRNTLLLDLGAALKHAKAAAGAPGQRRVLSIMSLYAEMDEGAEAVKALKGEQPSR